MTTEDLSSMFYAEVARLKHTFKLEEEPIITIEKYGPIELTTGRFEYNGINDKVYGWAIS